MSKKFNYLLDFFVIKTTSQDLSTTGLEGCLPASGPTFERAFHDWF